MTKKPTDAWGLTFAIDADAGQNISIGSVSEVSVWRFAGVSEVKEGKVVLSVNGWPVDGRSIEAVDQLVKIGGDQLSLELWDRPETLALEVELESLSRRLGQLSVEQLKAKAKEELSPEEPEEPKAKASSEVAGADATSPRLAAEPTSPQSPTSAVEQMAKEESDDERKKKSLIAAFLKVKAASGNDDGRQQPMPPKQELSREEQDQLRMKRRILRLNRSKDEVKRAEERWKLVQKLVFLSTNEKVYCCVDPVYDLAGRAYLPLAERPMGSSSRRGDPAKQGSGDESTYPLRLRSPGYYPLTFLGDPLFEVSGSCLILPTNVAGFVSPFADQLAHSPT